MNRPEPELRELLQYYRWLRVYGYNDSHSGNASVRVGSEVWITPTGACADTLETGAFVRCGLEDGPGTSASQDAPLHLAVYRNNPRAAAVLHSHCPHAVAITMAGGDAYTPADLEGRLYFPRVPVFDIPFETYFEDSPGTISDALAAYPVAIARGHGIYAAGETLERAYKWTCSLEMSAHTAWIAGLTRPR